MAQPVERRLGKAEVASSILAGSFIRNSLLRRLFFCAFRQSDCRTAPEQANITYLLNMLHELSEKY